MSGKVVEPIRRVTKQELLSMSHGNNPPFISVEIEASGPVQGLCSMLSLGACVVGEAHINFYREFRLVTLHHDPEALTVTGF